MSKKIDKKKKVTKVIKPSKSKPALKKAKKELVKKAKPVNKTLAKKPIKNIVKKKIKVEKVVKKVNKPVVKKTAQPKKDTKKELVKKKIIIPSKAIKEEKLAKVVKPIESVAEPKKAPFVLGEKKKYKRRKNKKKKNKGDDEEPEIFHDELVEQLLRATKKLRSQPKKPRILKTFVNPMTSLSVVLPENQNKKTSSNPKKEPKGKFTLEYVMNTTVGILYEFITSPSGLIEWFADEVAIFEGVFTFVWDGSEQKAKLIGVKENEFVRLHWLEKTDDSYFEFRIHVDKVTKDVSLIITDFLDDDSDLETSKRLWDSQIDRLLLAISSY